ncbi:MAG: hypothetical protein M5R36_12860 [Deltaproteobacteria bacterium]|nr:hypothetical protein [Deltaproteobacteria bacterium]
MKCTTMVVTHLVAAVAPYLDRVAFIDKDKHLFDVGPAADMFAAGPMTRLYGQLVRVTRMEHCIAFDLG